MRGKFWPQLMWLLVCVLAGIVLTLSIAATMGLWPFGLTTSMHLVQWMQTVLVMLLPPLLWSRFFLRESPIDTLRLRCERPALRWIILAALLMVVSLPLMDWIAVWTRQLPLPDDIEALGTTWSEVEEQTLRIMLSPDGIGGWCELVMLMSVATAIGEEVMFRGALVRAMSSTRLSPHGIAVIVGLVFSLIHFDIFGLIPRWLLGTLFVYLVYWSGSLWPAVVAHALNNLFAIVEYKFAPDGEASEAMLGGNLWLVAVSAIVSALLLAEMSRHHTVDNGPSAPECSL